MMDGLKPYDGYKEATEPWLGMLPSHWDTKRAKWLFTKLDRAVRSNDDVVTCFRDGIVTLRRNRRVRGFTESLQEIGYQGIRRGDLVIHAMDAFAGAVGVSDSDGKGTPVYSVCRAAAGVSPHYYAYIVREMARSQWIQALAKGIRERSTEFRFADFGSLPVPVPPLPEQVAIVKFITHLDRHARRYIHAKQELHKLLAEQKQAISHRAVTRGLDPNVRFRSSDVAWIGDIPEHWQVSRVKNEFLCLNRSRIPLSTTERGAMSLRQYDYYGASGIIDKVDNYLFDDELLLIAEDGANLVLRNLPLAIIARGKFWVNNHAHILKPKRGNLEYLGAVMETLNFKPWISGAAQPKLTQDRLMSIAIAVPPSEEQGFIVASVQNQTRSIDAAMDRCQREAGLLKEYRTRIVSDVVTGKLDVRKAAASLTYESKDPAQSDTIMDDVLDAASLDSVVERSDA